MLTASLEPLYGTAEAGAIADRLLEDRYGITRLRRTLEPEAEFTDGERVEKDLSRLLKWEPVQYVTGFTEFYGRKFRVTPATLIPRVETEELVRCALTLTDQPVTYDRVLDIGTGSGVIAITLQKRTCAYTQGWDISEEALEIARENARALDSDAEFHLIDILHPPADTGQFDLVVSNPPYVLESERERMRRNVTRYEPASALYVPDDDPLVFYRAILDADLVAPGGTIWFEINERYPFETMRLLTDNGFEEVVVWNDLHGKSRFATGQKRER